MNIEAFDKALENHVKTTTIPQLTHNTTRFAVGVALGAGMIKAETWLPQLTALGCVKQITDAEGKPTGQIDIDTARLRDAIYVGFSAAPTFELKLAPGVALEFSKSDAESLFRALGVA